MPESNIKPVAVLLAVATIAAVGMLALSAADRESVLAWAVATLPLVVAAGSARFAMDARRRGDSKSATDLIIVGLTANVAVSCIAGLL